MQYCLSIVANAISNIKQYLFVNNFMQCRIQRQKKIGMNVTTSTTSLLELSNEKPTESIFSLHNSIFEKVYYLNLNLTFLNSSYSYLNKIPIKKSFDLSLVLLLISNLTNELRLHQFLRTCSSQLF